MEGEEVAEAPSKRKHGILGCGPMCTTGNMAENYKKWSQAFKLYLRASSLDEETDSRKVALFLHTIGERGVEIFNSFEKDDETIKYSDLLQIFKDYFIPKTNVTYECHNFFTCKQGEEETLEQFCTNLRTKSQTCKFGSLQDMLIKSIFICNMHSKYNYVREKLLIQDELTLDEAVQVAKSLVVAKSHALTMQEPSVLYVNESRSRTPSRYSSSSQGPQRSYSQQSQQRSQQSSQQRSRQSSQQRSQQSSYQSQVQPGQQQQPLCSRCGQVHRYKCPAASAECLNCHRIGHFQKMCTWNVNYMEAAEQSNCEESSDFFIGHIRSSTQSDADWSINVTINHVDVECLLDTGSFADVMNIADYNSLNIKKELVKCQTTMTAYGGSNVEILGHQTLQCKVTINNTSVTRPITFIIANVTSPTVLGRYTCMDLGLVKRIYNIEPAVSQIVSCECQNKSMSTTSSQSNVLESDMSCNQMSKSENQDKMSMSQPKSEMSNSQSNDKFIQDLLAKYDSVFVGLGCLPGECNITVNPDVSPRIDAPRKVPFALYNRLQQELDKMEQMDVITKVTEPTDWVSSLILVEKKNGQLRVCLDPRNLNQAICRSHYPIPTVDMVRSKVAGAKYYSTLDASSGFCMCCLNEESSYLTCFNTPFGRYRFKRLPYGVSCAPEYFHRVMTETFGDIPGVTVYSDDILVSGKTINEHNQRLTMVFERAQQLNVKFNRVKCSFAVTNVKYLGHIFTEQGVIPDNEKIRAITEMPSPTCTKDLQRFLGMINYLGPFIKNLAEEVAPLRELLKKENNFTWNTNYEGIFNHLKSLICNTPVLAHFDVNVPIVLSVDSSSTAVGAVLLQNNHPIYYASKTLTTTQQNMAQIEKELYAIVFACVRFHQFIYGQTVTVETDHRPLITLFKKSLAEVPTRLQRMMLKIQAYSLNVIYKKGTLMFIADTLSRAALSETSVNELDEDIVVHVNSLIKSLPVSPERLQWLIDATDADEDMQILKEYYFQGWPITKSQVLPQVQEYWHYRHDLHTENGLIFRSGSILIPKKIRPDILKIIHCGHLGVERSKAFARGNVFWPFMSNDIKNLVESCSICLKHRNSNPPQPLMSHALPRLPWEKLGIDFMYFKNKTYIVVEDYYSNYIEVVYVSTTSAKVLISSLKPIFSRHGIPFEIISDNGPPFNSTEFKKFTTEWDIKHTTSSPYVPRSNGLAESGVKICKNMFTKCDESGSDPYLALLQYRNTPRGNLASPAQLLMSRNLRTQLPTIAEKLKPKTVRFEEHLDCKQKNQIASEKYYNKKTKTLQELKKGEQVYYKKSPESVWVPGEIVDVCPEPRSYVVGSSDGFVGRRNRQHILQAKTRSVSPKQEPQSAAVANGQPVERQPTPEPPDKDQVTHGTPTPSPAPGYTRYGRVVKPPIKLNL